MTNEKRKELLHALGRNGRIITELIPELEMIIGKQPDISELVPREAQNRFNLVFEKFIGVFAKINHPMVLFLDDLQWADQASLQFINYFLSGRSIKFLLFIVACRNRENPALKILLQELKESETTVNEFQLTNLIEKNIRELLMNLLKCSEKKVDALGRMVMQKTNGNPFFVNEFLHTIYNEKLIHLEPNSGWLWNEEEIGKMQITDNVVDLLAQKISKLPDKILELLKLCSFIGNRIDPSYIAWFMEVSLEEVVMLLKEAANSGYLGVKENRYVFHHNRIQEAAYSLVGDKEKPNIHYRIGKMIMEKIGNKEQKDLLFHITDHLNKGMALSVEKKERENLARLNYKCGLKAKSTSAYGNALKYFKTGIKVIEEKFPADCITSLSGSIQKLFIQHY